MSDPTTRPPSDVPLKNPRLAAFLAWLVPGLGHFYQGRIGKGILYATCILGLYIVGMAIGDGRVVFWRWINPMRDPENFRFSYIGQFFVGLPALPALIQETLMYFGMPPLFGGIMALDANQQLEINRLQPQLGRLMEIGWVYTLLAGLLNVLAIYDAYDGPAYGEDETEASKVAPVAVEGSPA
ncbi:MAG: DUF6677 family protein [Isosphaeraceae bacterium]